MCERRNASMVVTPWFGSCIPQPRLKLHSLACFAFFYYDCHGDGYDDVAGDFDDEHGDCIS